MNQNRIKWLLSSAFIFSLPFALGSLHAAKPIDLRHQNIEILNSLSGVANSGMNFKETSRGIDIKQKLHVRIHQTYNGYSVWGADAVLHIPNGGQTLSHADLKTLTGNKNTTMNGTFYENISADLANTPAIVFTKPQEEKAIQAAIDAYQQKVGKKVEIKKPESSLIVYIDDQNKAHWAFKVIFDAAALKAGGVPAQPNYILDAVTLKTYEQWDNIQTEGRDDVLGGGFGGNVKMGVLVYDGLHKNFSALNIQRDAATATCYLQNPQVTVKKCTSSSAWFGCEESTEFTTPCAATDPVHNNIYWNGEADAANGGYSPSNDALYNGKVIKNMYKDWYNMDVLENEDKSEMMLTMVVHIKDFDNAYWDDREKIMSFGDGADLFYPLTSLGVAAHEISHGFTSQHSGLIYKQRSGGMNEAFSDMAAQAAEFYAYGKNNWQIGPEIVKDTDTIGEALRYMDLPSKDCNGNKPGPGVRCSIDDATQYTDDINVHYTSGVFNRFFYTLSTTEGWDVKKAFGVMVQANAYHWIPKSKYTSAACGVLDAAQDLGYEAQDLKDIRAAFRVVKVVYGDC